MRQLAFWTLLFFSTSLFAWPSPYRQQKESSWAGQSIILKKPSTPLFRDSDDQQIHTLTRTDFMVLREKGERIWVRDLNREGWILKEAALLTANAIPYLTEQINANPQDSYLYAKRSKAHEFKGNLEGALSDYNEAIRIIPNSSGWHNNRANVYQKMRKYDKAIEDYTLAMEIMPTSAIVYNNRGNSYNHLREYDKALADYNQAIKLDPEYVLALTNRANCYCEQKKFDLALKDLETAIKKEPRHAAIFNNRAAIRIEQKQYDGAMKDIEQALEIEPRSGAGYYQRGNLWKAQKQYDRAIWDYDHVLWLDSRSISSQFQRAVCLIEKKEYERAIKDFEAILKFDPQYLFGLNSYALLLASCPEEKSRDGKKALEMSQKAVELAKGKGVGRFLATLAAAQAETGDFTAAIQSQEKALEDKTLAPEDIEEMKKRLEGYREKKPFRKE